MTRALLRSLVCALVLAGCSSRATTGEPARPATGSSSQAGSAAPSAGAATQGRVVQERFRSAALGVDKDVVVYLPRGYSAESGRRWPVFYYLHGLGGHERNWTQDGKLDHAADRLALDAIVVMPDGDDSFYIDSARPIDYDRCRADGTGLFLPGEQPPDTTCVRKRSYETYIIEDLVGWVDARYRTIARRDGRAIAGLSMGGFGAMGLALRHPDRFAAAASHSGAIALMYAGPRPFAPGKAQLFPVIRDPGAAAGPVVAWVFSLFGTDLAAWKAHDVVELAGKLPSGKVALYFDCGSEDDFALHDNVQYVHEALTARRIEHAYYLSPGRHDFALWSARVPHSLAFLRDHTAKPE